MANEEASILPNLESLHLRHYGLSPAVCGMLAEAAHVCLTRHHSSPTKFTINKMKKVTHRSLTWPLAEPRSVAAHSNRDDATEAGAYSISLATVEAELGLVAVERADIRTGADYYIAPLNGQARDDAFEDAYRLEVSGINNGDEAAVDVRLRAKVKQASEGKSALPAYACVVAFSSGCIALVEVKV